MKNRPTKMTAALAVLLCFSLAAIAQDAAPAEGANPVYQETQTTPVFDETQPFNTAPVERDRPNVLGTVGVFVRMIAVLAFVIACIYGLMWFMKKYSNKENNSDQFLRVVASIMLAPGKYVKVVSLLDEKAYMLGVSDNAVNVIAEVEDKETIAAMNLYADKASGGNGPKSFEDILGIFMPRGAKGSVRDIKGAALSGTDTAQMLRQMRSTVGGTESSTDETGKNTQSTGVDL